MSNADNDAGLDLSPRDVADTPPRRGRRRWLPIALLAVVIAAGGVVVTQFLREAVDYFCTVDEIGVRDGCDADKRLRVLGTVAAGSVAMNGDTTTFTLEYGGETLPVTYRGEPGGIFRECESVVVHGRVNDDGTLAGDGIDVKHSNEYAEENADRLDDDGTSAASATGECPDEYAGATVGGSAVPSGSEG